MDLEVLSWDDEAAVAEWFGVIRATHEDKWPGEPGWTVQELRAMTEMPQYAHAQFLARDDHRTAVGALWVRFALRENPWVAYIQELNVHPAHRRRGVGSALLARAEQAAHEHGRTELHASTEVSASAVTPSPGDGFARRAGFVPALAKNERDLEMPPDFESLAAIEDACLPFASGYSISTWIGPCPEQLVEGRAVLARSISADAPDGELGREPENWDADRVRDLERSTEAMGRDQFTAAAIEDATGGFVAVSDAGIPRGTPELAYQYDTVVLGPHRGHRLGTLVKIANLRSIAAASPRTKRIMTSNAADNDAMIRVNEALGFRLFALGTTWKKLLS